MFTSRAEYRLLIREDNADTRLRKIGYELGLVCRKDYELSERKKEKIKDGIEYLRRRVLKPDKKTNALLRKSGTSPLTRALSALEILKRPEIKLKELAGLFKLSVPPCVISGIETEVKYEGFIKRQISEVERFKNLERIKIPVNFDYSGLSGLSSEIREKLLQARPISLGQASLVIINVSNI
jgi:tRNA uridine 5-carboxymethylaminomethyl modification enzyme